jgi:hypothetical protein
MSATFFSKFPRRHYDVRNNGVFEIMTDISRGVDINDSNADAIILYNSVRILDGERPDVLSHRLYGSADFYWTFFIINNHLREGLLSAWPLSALAFEKMIDETYNGFSVLTCVPIFGEDELLNDLSILDFNEEYLPYLTIQTYAGGDMYPGVAQIAGYDDTRFQLWLTNVYLPAKFETSDDAPEYFKICWFTPDGYDESTSAIKQREWMEGMLSRMMVSNPAKYATYLERYNDKTEYTRAAKKGQTPEEFRTYLLTLFTLETIYPKTDFWYEAKHAPDYYVSEIDDSEQISALNALVLNEHNPNVVSYYENEVAIDESKHTISCLKPEMIRRFRDDYFDLLNSNE